MEYQKSKFEYPFAPKIYFCLFLEADERLEDGVHVPEQNKASESGNKWLKLSHYKIINYCILK